MLAENSGPHQVVLDYSPIAQLVERLTVNQLVPGSSPGRGAKHEKGPSGEGPFFIRQVIYVPRQASADRRDHSVTFFDRCLNENPAPVHGASVDNKGNSDNDDKAGKCQRERVADDLEAVG